MSNDIDIVWKKTSKDVVSYFIPVSDGEYLIFGRSEPSGAFALGIAECKEPNALLGDPVPVDLGPYRHEIQEAYGQFSRIDQRYRVGKFRPDDSESDILSGIHELCTRVTSQLNTRVGHA